jgi:prevent-host-death family protein
LTVQIDAALYVDESRLVRVCRGFNEKAQPAPCRQAPWTIAEAKAKLSEILRLARAGEPQTIGTEEPCVVVSAARFAEMWQPDHLGKFLIESAPRDYELELPSRSDNRGDPFAGDAGGRPA